MRKLSAFMFTSLDGYFQGVEPWSIDWHNVDEEFDEFSTKQLDGNDLLVFGRVTYQGMAQYWPSADALREDPGSVARMNALAKVVVSRTLEPEDVTWANTRVVRDIQELAELKKQKGEGILVLGSSVLTAALLEAGLLDELRVMVNPILLGAGSSFAEGPGGPFRLRLLGVRQFANGNVLLTYAPRASNA